MSPATATAPRRGGFWRRVGAMLLKEFLQLRRDRVTFPEGQQILAVERFLQKRVGFDAGKPQRAFGR